MERDQTADDVVAVDVTWDEYMAHCAHDFCEWVDGVVIKFPPVNATHTSLSRYFMMLLDAYRGNVFRAVCDAPAQSKQQPRTRFADHSQRQHGRIHPVAC